MAATFHLELVTPEAQVLDTEAVEVIFRLHDGQIGILAHHSPLLGKVCAGPLTVKTPARQEALYKVREETEARVSDFSAMEAILGKIGFRPFFIYEKFREVFALDGVLVMLDETPIGNFLEIEGGPAGIDAAAARLGFSRGDYLTDSYYRLFLLSGSSGHMVFAG